MIPSERSSDYVNLNREGTWAGLRWQGLELRSDGALQLASVPLLDSTPPEGLEGLAAPAAPAGIAIDPEGSVYFSDPGGDRVWRIDGCTGERERVPCVGGTGTEPGHFHEPRGLLIPRRSALFVADSGNHRIEIFDPGSGELLGIWGQGPGNTPASDAPGSFSSPWTLAVDSAGSVYVLDYGNRRVQKFDATGNVQPAFWEHMQAAKLLQEPGDLAVWEKDTRLWLFVLDRQLHQIFAFDANGYAVLDQSGEPVAVQLSESAQPMGMVAGEGALFLGDNDKRRVLQYEIGDTLEEAGEAHGYSGPVAALALDGRGGLLVHTGSDQPPVRLEVGKGCSKRGALWTANPIQIGGARVQWHRLHGQVSQLLSGAGLQFFFLTSNDQQKLPKVSWNAERGTFFDDPDWKQRSLVHTLSVTDLYIGGEAASCLWIGAEFTSDGLVSPALSEIRVEFDHEGYTPYLPAIYRNDAPCGDFVERLLSLFESFLTEAEWEIDSLPRLFDPAAAPGQFLDWLASWLGQELDETWDEDRKRRTIAEAFSLYGRRGTRAGLERSLRLLTGMPAVIEEPIQNAAWWVLPAAAEACCSACADRKGPAATVESGEGSVLGWSTMLASAQPDGAVAGSTAILGQSHLIAAEDFGAPLFNELAYRFSVLIPRAYVTCAEALPQVKAVIEREKPAHTEYHLCVTEPRMRVGFQARIGIDTVVAGPPSSLRLGESSALGADAALGGPAASRLGERTRVGITTRVG